MIDLVLQEDLSLDERERSLLYLFYRKFFRTEFAKNITPPSLDIFIETICLELFDRGIVTQFTLSILLANENWRNQITKRLPVKENLHDVLNEKGEQQLERISVLIADALPSRNKRTYQKYVFSDETVTAEKYFELHGKIVDLLPQFIARASKKHLHPLLVFEEIQKDMIQFFNLRTDTIGIGQNTIKNIANIFIRICFGKQIQMLDIIDKKLFLCGVSIRNDAEMGDKIAPDLARSSGQDRYADLQKRRDHYTKYMLAKLMEKNENDPILFHEKVCSFLLPDLENFLNLPMMREIFGSRSVLYSRLTTQGIPSGQVL